MKVLCPDLLSFDPSPTDLTSDANQVLELRFNDILSFYGEEVWSVEVLVSFVDNSPVKSIASRIQVRRLNEQVSQNSDLSTIKI